MNQPQSQNKRRLIILADCGQRKGRYVLASRRANQTLAGWCFSVLDRAADESERDHAISSDSGASADSEPSGG